MLSAALVVRTRPAREAELERGLTRHLGRRRGVDSAASPSTTQWALRSGAVEVAQDVKRERRQHQRGADRLGELEHADELHDVVVRPAIRRKRTRPLAARARAQRACVPPQTAARTPRRRGSARAGARAPSGTGGSAVRAVASVRRRFGVRAGVISPDQRLQLSARRSLAPQLRSRDHAALQPPRPRERVNRCSGCHATSVGGQRGGERAVPPSTTFSLGRPGERGCG